MELVQRIIDHHDVLISSENTILYTNVTTAEVIKIQRIDQPLEHLSGTTFFQYQQPW